MVAQARELQVKEAGTCPFEVGERVRLSKGEVNYRLEGPEGAPVVVCIHGLNASLGSFLLISAAFQKHGFRVLTYDLYGFGLSDSPTGKFDQELYAGQLQELLDAVVPESCNPGWQPVHVLGFCLGGIVATEFALRHPERVGRLLLIAPCGLSSRAEAPCQTFLFKCLRPRVRGGLMMALVSGASRCCATPWKYYLRGKELDMCTPDVRDPESEHFRAQRKKNTERFAWGLPRSAESFMRGLRDMPIWREDYGEAYARLAASEVPVLFIWGEEDGVMPLSEAEDLVTKLFGPAGRSCVVLQGGGHGVILEEQDVVQIGHCGAAWFTDCQEPDWLRCLAAHSLGAADPTRERAAVAGVAPTPAQALTAEAL